MAGRDEEESPEAEAGGILESETAIEIHEVREMIYSYLKALAEAAPAGG